MELFLFAGLVIAAAGVLLWRARRRDFDGRANHDDVGARVAGGLPDKDVGMLGQPNRGRPWGGGN
jgi:hypothetical protein